PTMSRPAKRMLPCATSAGGLSSRAMAKSRVDFPQPDSPTMATNSPGATLRSTWSTARTGPWLVRYSTTRSWTSRMGGAPSTAPPDRPQGRVGDLVEGVVEQGEPGAEQRDADAGRDRPERTAGRQRLVVLGPVQHRAPADLVDVAEADELQPGGRQHGVERGPEEVRHDQRGHRGDELEQDDEQAALAAHPGRLQELAVAQRERLGAQLAGAEGPAGHRDDDHQRRHPAALGVGGQDD